jgi:hypothetical protein
VGYCGLDRTRSPLKGDEIRGCWEAAAAPIGLGSRPAAMRERALGVVSPERPEFSLFADVD